MYGEIGHKTKTWANPQLLSYVSFPFVTGIGAYYYLTPHSTLAGGGSKCIDANGLVAAIPWIVPNTITLTQIGLEVISVTSVDAGGVLRFALFSDTGNFAPYTLIRDLGTIAADSASVTNPSFSAAFSQVVQPGIYWIAMAPQGCATARPTTAAIGANNVLMHMGTSTTNYGIPLLAANMRTWRTWTPSTSPAFTLATTTFATAPIWGGGNATSSNAWPRIVIRIA